MKDDFYRNLVQMSSMCYAYNKIIYDIHCIPYDFEVIECNNSFAEIFGVSPSKLTGAMFSDLVPGLSKSSKSILEAFMHISEGCGVYEFDEFIEPIGMWFHIKLASWQKGFFVIWLTEISKERLIARISEDFLQIKEEIDYQKIADYILGVSEAHYAFFYLYDEKNDSFIFKASSGFRYDLQGITTITNHVIYKKTDCMKTNDAILRYKSIRDFSSDADNVCKLLKTFDILPNGEFIIVKINNESGILGIFILIMPENKFLQNESIVLVYARQVGLLLTRKKEQQELINAHNKLLESNKRLEKAEEVAHIGNWEYDSSDRRMIWSDELYRICGFEPGSFTPNLRKSLYIVHPEDRSKVKSSIEAAINSRSLYDLECRILRPDGEVRWVLLKGLIEYNEYGAISKISGSVLDITETKLMENALINEKERLRITLLSVGDGVVVVDKDGCIEMMNEVACRLTGYTIDESTGMPFDNIFNIIHELTREKHKCPVEKVLSTGNVEGLTNHMLLISKDGREIPVAYSAAPIKDKKGDITGVVLVFRDITEEKESQKEIMYLSFHDQLTGLYNRCYFNAELERLDNTRNYPLAVIISDINGLKLTNDAFGHATGDKLLKKAAEIIKSQCRSDDIVVRLAGDEFAILLPKTGEAEVEKIVKRMRAAISNVKVDSVMLSVSIGWAVKTSIDQDINKVIKKADDYMYRRKLFESPSMRGKTLQTMLNTLHEKNYRERQHSERVSSFCVKIARSLGLREEKIDELNTAGLMHDIGKIAIDESILNKAEPLTQDELREVQRHPEIGYRILSSVNAMSEMAEYILAHHERWDGEGYPKGLKGEEIPLEARIIAVADAYDAMTSERPYKERISEQDAVKQLIYNSGSQFDSRIVFVFLKNVLKVPDYKLLDSGQNEDEPASKVII